MTAKPVLLVAGPPEAVEAMQARHPQFDVMALATPQKLLQGREVTILNDGNKPVSLQAFVEAITADLDVTSVDDILHKAGLATVAHRRSYEIRVAKVLQGMGWRHVQTRNGCYRQHSYIRDIHPPVPVYA